MEVLAIIPARGGSKGILRKNLVKIGNKSLVAHSISHAQKSKLISRIIVSTDDDEIAKISVNEGAEVPFMRPKSLSKDHVLDYPVFQHALEKLKEINYKPDFVVHLRPTAPYRESVWIDECCQLLYENHLADSVRSVSEPDKHPYRIFTIKQDGFLDPIMKHCDPQPYLLRRQDLPRMYYYNCVIDVTRYNTIMIKKSMTGDNILPYIMDPNLVFDIDSPRDLEVTRYFLDKKI